MNELEYRLFFELHINRLNKRTYYFNTKQFFELVVLDYRTDPEKLLSFDRLCSVAILDFLFRCLLHTTSVALIQ